MIVQTLKDFLDNLPEDALLDEVKVVGNNGEKDLTKGVDYVRGPFTNEKYLIIF